MPSIILVAIVVGENLDRGFERDPVLSFIGRIFVFVPLKADHFFAYLLYLLLCFKRADLSSVARRDLPGFLEPGFDGGQFHRDLAGDVRHFLN